MSSYYESLFRNARNCGLSDSESADKAATAFLDGKPERRGNKKITATERHSAFWHASFLHLLPKEAWAQDSLVLALARYLSQDSFNCPSIVSHVAGQAPEAVQRAARYAGLVLRQESPRWREIESLAVTQPTAFGELVQVFEIFKAAHQVRISAIEQMRQRLLDLTPLDLLAYASLYAFEYVIPGSPRMRKQEEPDFQETWAAIEDILEWKLATCDSNSLRLNDQAIGTSLGIHLAPFLFPSETGHPRRSDLYDAFIALVDAQIELNAFVDRSADAFSYDDSICFVRQDQQLEIVVIDAKAGADWQRDGDKLVRLHQYWLYRGMDALMASPEILALVSPTHIEANLEAFAKAMGTGLRLQEVYGVSDRVRTDTGLEVDVFRALLTIELMTAFYIVDFLQPYNQYLSEFGHPWLALGRLAFGGLLQTEMQNRFPVTWSDKVAKIANITPWTVSAESPKGHPRSAEAILDFWTSDWIALAEQLRRGNTGIRPRLQERPMLKMGRHLFQLPWMLAVQNNATAAINNLRRLGARRGEAREETQRIEQRLGALFRQRGFQVLLNHELPTCLAGAAEVGDIDLLCARDDRLLVLELKSTYLRRSKKEAWIHRHTTLRKAGAQLHRKVVAVLQALESDGLLLKALGVESAQGLEVTGWIVDTSIECDHQRFHGFLKVSVEEVLIALRDDSHWLNDPDGIFQAGQTSADPPQRDSIGATHVSLYHEDFSAVRFIEIVESATIRVLQS